MFYIDDSILQKNASQQTVYVKEIPSLRIKYTDNTVSGELYNIVVPHVLEEFSNHDGNVVSIGAFPPFPKTYEGMKLILYYLKTNIKNSDTKIFFDGLHEGFVLSLINPIHDLVTRLNLNPKNVYLFTTGMEAHKLYERYCIERNIVNRINIRVLNVWERHLSRRKPDEFTEPNLVVKEKDKLFLSFNRMCRKHRLALLGLLYDKNLVDKSFYSFFPSAYDGYPAHQVLRDVKHYLTDETYNKVEENIKRNYIRFPLLLNTDSVDDNVNYVKNDDMYYYDNSYFSLVTETFFFDTVEDYRLIFDETSVFFSEKIFKPILCKHPFIQLNRPYALEYLRKIGYKTFHPFINEDYDTIENDEQRLLAIVNEIERLSKKTVDEWIEWQHNVNPIVEHNYRNLVSKDIKDHSFTE